MPTIDATGLSRPWWSKKRGLFGVGLLMLIMGQIVGYQQGVSYQQSLMSVAPAAQAAESSPPPSPPSKLVPTAAVTSTPPTPASLTTAGTGATPGADLVTGCDQSGSLTKAEWEECQSSIINKLAERNHTSPEIIQKVLDGQ